MEVGVEIDSAGEEQKLVRTCPNLLIKPTGASLDTESHKSEMAP